MRRRRRRKNNPRKIIIFSLIGLLFIMAVGYSAFQTNLNINVKGNIKNKPISTTDLIKLVVTTGDGLYASAYEEGRYIYRGADPDNYISFNNETWRIMSVESDGTLKIRRATALTSQAWDTKGNRDSSTSTYCTNASDAGCNAWAATDNLMGSPLPEYTQYFPYANPSNYTSVFTGTVTQDASLNTYLNNTYYNTLSDEAKSYVVEGTFDVSSPGRDKEDSVDNLATNIQQAKQYQWKGKVALMTILEWQQTSTDITCASSTLADIHNDNSKIQCSNDNWMFSDASEWTLSPVTYSGDYFVNLVSSGGYTDGERATNSHAARPVLYLTSDITLSGQGTLGSPYTINS